MLDQISQMMKEAMKAKDKQRLGALRYMKSMLMENKTASKPVAEEDVIIKHHKKLNDSLEMFKNDADKVEEIKAEMKVVEEFMPKQMEEAEVQTLIDQIKSSQDNPNMGTIMKELSPQIKGKFDGKKASQMVKASL